ncbi:MAG: LacI family DNA-binding transcriptional regulator [Verrucomicrobiota bacterium]
MKGAKPPSLQDVADAAGVHRTTVSLALRGSLKLPSETRERICRVASEMGYRMNPLVSALMTARVSRKEPAHQATLAFLSIERTPPPEWQVAEFSYAWMFRGAAMRAEQRGYKLAPIWLYERGLSPDKFVRVMNARNIHGVLVAPQKTSENRVSLDWERFSIVEFGYNLVAPAFHRVVHDYFHSMQTACRRAVDAGFKRIGFAVPQRADVKTHHLWSAAYLHFQQSLPKARRLAVHVPSEVTTESLASWIKTERPDVLIVGGYHYPLSVDSAHLFKVPKGLCVISLDCRDRDGTNPGVFQDWPEMGIVAVDLLIGQLQRGERGVPRQARSVLVEGLWRGELRNC